MSSSGNFLNNMCHWPEWLTLSSWLILLNKDTIRLWSNWFEFLSHFEEIFSKSGKHILMPFPCFSENDSWSARALKALQTNFIAILGAGREDGRTGSWVWVQEHWGEYYWPSGKLLSAGTHSRRLMLWTFTAILQLSWKFTLSFYL